MKNIVGNDVKLLREGCELYRVSCIVRAVSRELYRASAVKLTGLDPLVSAVTGA